MRERRLKFLASLIAYFVLALPSVSQAQCTLPYQLSNGQTADAIQVMANYNALVACLNSAVNTGSAGQVAFYAANGNSISGESLSALIDAAMGATQGSILYRDASSWQALPPGSNQQFLQAGGSGGNPQWGTPSGFSIGLWSGLFSSLPTRSGTGFTTQLNFGAGATAVDSPAGIYLSDRTGTGWDNVRGLTQVAPTPPYTRTGLLAANPYGSQSNTLALFGWYDGTKLQTLCFGFSNGAPQFRVVQWNNVSSYNGDSTTPLIWAGGPAMWLQLKDDGSTVYFNASYDGVNFETFYSTPKANGFLANYDTLFFGVYDSSQRVATTLMSYQ
jgi:hypothetical protein